MDALDGLALARHFWPRLIAAAILAALVFFPKPSYGLIEAVAKGRAQDLTSLLMDAVLPATQPQDDGRTVGHRRGLTGAPTGAPIPSPASPYRL